MTAPGTIVFSHGNGFPAGTYRVLFEAWRAAGHKVQAIERLGHDPAYPVTSNWPHLRDQLIHFIEREVGGPAFLVGHSMGGLLSLLAASRRPDIARGLVLLDPPLFTGLRAQSLRMMKAARLLPRVSPGAVSQQRRHEWPSREAVRTHLGIKHLFARWDPRVFDDYLACGFDDEAGQVVLGFRREVETRIYNSLPHHVDEVLRRHPLRCPVGFVAGTQSAEMRRIGLQGPCALAKERFAQIEGTHLYPMEKPDETAAEVLRLIASF
jgi:pimeloyl-ACP methyl ester carboxylesterase